MSLGIFHLFFVHIYLEWKYQSGSSREYRIGSKSNKRSSKRKSKSTSSYENSGVDYVEPSKNVVYDPDLKYYDPKEFGIGDNSDTLNMKPNGTEKFAEYSKVIKLKDDETNTLSQDSDTVIATTRSNVSTPLPIESPSIEHKNTIKSDNDSDSIASVRDFPHREYGNIVWDVFVTIRSIDDTDGTRDLFAHCLH